MALRKNAFIGLTICLVLIAAYSITYWRLRLRHDFVHNATFYTDIDGRHVRTDHISLGEWRDGMHWTMTSTLFWPARIAEAMYWRYVAE